MVSGQKSDKSPFVHKFLNNRLPQDLLNFFDFIQLEAEGDDNQGTRGAKLKLLFVPSYNTITFGNKSFSKICITQWNSIQRTYPDVPLSTSDFCFVKSLAFTHCFRDYWAYRVRNQIIFFVIFYLTLRWPHLLWLV